jgi:hypothetical protein
MVAQSRIALRVAPETKERWQAEAQASGLTLTAFIVSKIEGQRLSPELETFLAQRIDDVLQEQSRPSSPRDQDRRGLVVGGSPALGRLAGACGSRNLAAVLLPKTSTCRF